MNINKKKITPIILISIFILMLGLSFAAVPLYDLFCRVTGFGGTTQNASNKEIPKIIVNIFMLLFSFPSVSSGRIYLKTNLGNDIIMAKTCNAKA